MKSLFYPGARLIRTQASPTGEFVATVLTPDDYVARAGKYFCHQRILRTRNFAEDRSLGQSPADLQHLRVAPLKTNGAPFTRGINSIQIFNDGKRWWILTIAWQEESATLKLPTEFLPAK